MGRALSGFLGEGSFELGLEESLMRQAGVKGRNVGGDERVSDLGKIHTMVQSSLVGSGKEQRVAGARIFGVGGQRVCTHVCMHTWVCVCPCLHARLCVHGVCVCMHVWGVSAWCMCVCTCIGMCVYAWMCVVEGWGGKWTDSGLVKIGSVSLTPKLDVQTGPRG